MSTLLQWFGCVLGCALVGVSCAAFAVTSDCLAQNAASRSSDLRENLRGRVTLIDGEPWVGAEVVLVGYALSNAPIAGADRVRAKTDARGRFKARLLPNRRYAAWAFEELPSEAGSSSLRESAVTSRVFAGDSLRLQEVESRPRPRVLKLSGLAAWQHHAPLRFRLRANLPMNCDLEIDGPDAEGRIDLPPWPATALRLVSAQGRVLAERTITSFDSGAECAFRPPVRVRVDAKFRVGEKPVVGGRVMHAVDMEWVEIGVTNDAGQATVEPFLSGRSSSWQFIVVPEEGSLTLARQVKLAQASAATDPDKAAEIVTAPISVEKSGKAMRGRVFLNENVPAADLELVYFVSCPTGSGSWHHRREAFRTRCDASGNFEIRGAPDNCEWRLYALPETGSEIVVLAVGRKPEPKLGSIVIGELPRLDLAVLESDGSPASFAKIVLSGRSGLQGIGLHNDHSFDTNRRGLLRMRIPENDILRLAAGRDGAYVQVDPQVKRDSERIELRLGKRAAIGGRVVDTAGRPVRRARVYYSVRRMTGARDLLSKYTGDWDTYTDENGMYSLPCPIDCVLRMHCSKTEKGKNVWARNGTPEVAVESGVVEVEDIVIDAIGQGAGRPAQRK